MKKSLLLLMTPNMSLQKWDELGQLSREMNYYEALCRAANLKLVIYSYGRMDKKYTQHYQNITVLEMPGWIPRKIPFKVQNLIYHFSSLFIYRKIFKDMVLAKTNQYSASTFGILLKLVFGIPLIIRMGFYHSHFKKLSLFSRGRERLVFSICDLILTTSSEAKDFITDRYGIAPKKILSMCNTLDLNHFRPESCLKEYDLIFVGRLVEVKNIEMMLAVLNKVNLKTLIIGKGPLDYLVKEAVKNNHRVIWKDRVDNVDLPGYYNRAHCFIIFSEYEGNPKALLEAMACGLAAIGTNVHGIRECIMHNFTGILVESNEDSLQKAVSTLLSNKVKLQKLGINASQWATTYCDMQKNIEKEVVFYSNYLNAGKLVYSN